MRKFYLCVSTFFLLLTQMANAQKTISGKVVSSADQTPIPGVTVHIKGTKTTAVTSSDGSFSITAKEAAPTLELSSIGFLPKSVSGLSASVIALDVDARSMSEVVVTGVGVATSKRKLGISVESITSNKLPAAPTASIDQALVGKIPGAQISSVSGNPGDPVNIVLRGINSTSGTSPMILVDGVQAAATDLNSFDLNNIERVEVVQGAASATIYGAQGANGVIQIFTKKGRKGAPQVSFSSSYATNEFVNIGHVQKSKLHPYKTDASGNILNAATGLPVKLNADGTLPAISYRFGAPLLGSGPATRLALLGPQNINDQPYNGNLKFYDHFAQVFQTGYTNNNNINLSGGGDRSDYNLNVSNSTTQSSILKNGKLNRTNLSLNVGSDILKGLRFRSITQLVYTKNTLKPYLGSPVAGGANNTTNTNYGGFTSGVYGFLNTSPFFDLTYTQPDGSLTNYPRANFLSVNTGNPYYTVAYSDGLDNKVEVVQNFNLNYQVNKFVELDAKYGLNYRTQNTRWTFYNQSTNPSTANYGTYVANNAPDETGEIDNWQVNETFQNLLGTATIRTDFERDFGLKIPIKTSTLFTYDYRKDNYKSYATYGLGLPLNPPINLGNTSSQAVSYDYYQPFTTYGYLVDQRFDIGDWGGISGGFRTDYSSNFGQDLSFTFVHGNGYLLLSSFNFWKNSGLGNVVSLFKLRSAYGEAGIQPGFGQRYPGLDIANLGSSLAYSLQASAKNPLIQVQISKEFEAGTDFSVNLAKGNWLSSVNGSFTYWKRKSNSVINEISLPPSSGYTGISDNIIDMSSNGIQAQLNLPLYHSKNLNWDFTVNFGKSRSLIDKVDGTIAQQTAAAGSVQLKLVAGQPIGQIFGYKALTSVGQLREDGKTSFIPSANQGDYEIVEGRVVNKNTKAIYFSDEATFIGDPNPKFNMAFINAIGYKDFVTIGWQLDWVHGSHLYNQTKEWMYRDGIHGDFDKQVTINGQTAAFTAYHGSAYYALGNTPSGPGNNATKDYFYEDASFLRLRNVSVSFNAAKIWKQNTFKKLELVLTGRNIWTNTKYSGFDPEINSGPSNSSFERGIDHSSLPNVKSYQIGLNVGF